MGLFHWQKERNSNADFIIICVFCNIGLNKDSGMDPRSGQLTKTMVRRFLQPSRPLLLVTIKKLAHNNSCRNCVPSEPKPEYGGIFFNKAEVKHTLHLLSQGNRECLEDLVWPLMLQPLKGHCREIIKAYPKVNKDGWGHHAEPLAQRLFRSVSDLSVCYYSVCFSTRGLEMKTECGS